MSTSTLSQSAAPGRIVGEQALRRHVLRVGMWMFLATVVLLFAAFSSAYIIRGASSDWRPIALPPILWLNTAIILLSSVTLQTSLGQARSEHLRAARTWMITTLLFGVAFLVGQLAAWRELWASGIGVPTSPHSSFFFILTGLHGLHLLAGLVVLSVAGARLAASTQSRPTRPEAVRAAIGLMELGALLWHFLAGLWVYLLIMLSFFR